jgi:GNAT superfamily N-acetyltransferase
MAPKVRIRRASRADRATLIAFHRALYVDHHYRVLDAELAPLYAYRDLDAALRDDVDAILSSEGSIALVAERGEEPIGYITGHVETDLRRVLARKGVIEDWYVVEAERGHGVGRLLVETILDIFRELGCEVAESQTWAGNTGARAAHAKLGFREIDVKMRMKLT